MVTPAGKELLRNTIHTAKFHNKILEENDMWRQFEAEKGLTMMVSDDAIRKRRHHRCRYHEKLRQAKLGSDRRRNMKDTSSNSSSIVIPASPKKWDHSGYAELYPEEFSSRSSSESRSRSRGRKQKSRKRRDTSSSLSSSPSSSSYSDTDSLSPSLDSNSLRKGRRTRKKSKSKKSSDRIPVRKKKGDSRGSSMSSKKKKKKH